jgi:hypothetical protein
MRKFSTSVGLLLLAVGFSCLGLLSFLKRPTEDAATGFLSETTYSLIGSLISILVGATFLVTAVLFVGTLFRRHTSITAEGRNADR